MATQSAARHSDETDHDFPLVISFLPPTRRQRFAAAAVVVTLVAIGGLVAPFAQVQIGRIDVFVPVLQTAMSLVDFLTATLVFSQYLIQQHRALLAVGSAYIFSGSMALLQTLSFPGGYAPVGVIGDGYNTPAWFFVLWHTTFPLAIMTYALMKNTKGPPTRATPARMLVVTVCCVSAAIAFLSWLVTAQVAHLPSFYTGSVTLQTRLGNQINVALCLLGATTLVVLYSRRRTILDLWLMVTLLAWLPNFVIAAVASSVRFSVGWYTARGFALIASSLLLIVLLTETSVLYSRLANAFTMLRRERGNRLMSIDAATAAIAHEIRSPLASIPLNVETAVLKLRKQPPDIEDVVQVLEDIRSASLRVNETISSIRNLFNVPTSAVSAVCLEDSVRQVLRLLEHELQLNAIVVTTDFPERRQYVRANVTDLQQVVLNLVKNAIEATRSAPDRTALAVSTRTDGQLGTLYVQDTGPGIRLQDQDHIFDAFFTTKPAGMGLGLAVCRTLIERTGGKLSLLHSGPDGSVFEVRLPLASGPARSLQ